ncbi:hypothetical protein CYMTET_44977 [Cymbomonas tetramitiformis]|uniref:Uncharacterized protein n=1 Tax=Cymbomonas tetramitiformis TaxID=36881 RepID=A0AAE0EYS6_9CHLO|nr:hypothetical protein CYMTET_44977 [Cymbomonas tetramitiformis]
MCDGVNLLSSDLRHVFTTSSQNVVVTQEAGSHSPIKYSVSDAETGLQSRKNVQNGQFVTYLESAPLPGNAGNSFVTELVHREGRGYLNYPTAWHKPPETKSGNKRPNGAASRDAEMEFESEASHATSLSLDGVTSRCNMPREGHARTPQSTALLADRTSSTSCDEIEFTEVEAFDAPQSYRSPFLQGGFVQPIVQETAESDVKGDMQCIDVDESYNTLRGEWQKVNYKPVQSQVNDAPVSWGLCIPKPKPKSTFQSPIRRILTINPQ